MKNIGISALKNYDLKNPFNLCLLIPFCKIYIPKSATYGAQTYLEPIGIFVLSEEFCWCRFRLAIGLSSC